MCSGWRYVCVRVQWALLRCPTSTDTTEKCWCCCRHTGRDRAVPCTPTSPRTDRYAGRVLLNTQVLICSWLGPQSDLKQKQDDGLWCFEVLSEAEALTHVLVYKTKKVQCFRSTVSLLDLFGKSNVINDVRSFETTEAMESLLRYQTQWFIRKWTTGRVCVFFFLVVNLYKT